MMHPSCQVQSATESVFRQKQRIERARGRMNERKEGVNWQTNASIQLDLNHNIPVFRHGLVC